MRYLWNEDVTVPDFPALQGDRDTQVLVIGGGMAGVMCARWLHKAGIDYLLVEGGRVGQGVTKGTTAVLTAQHDTLYSDLIATVGKERAGQYLDANLWAVETLRHMAEEWPCDLEDRPSLIYDLGDRGRMEEEVRAVRSLGLQAQLRTEAGLPFPVAGAVEFPGMAQFHPMKFLAQAVRGLNVVEHTFVRRLSGTVAETDRGRIRAKQVIVATHFPFVDRRGLYFMKMYQKRSFVVGLEGAPRLDHTAMDRAEDGMYFRTAGDLLLVGGGDRRTGSKGDGFETVRSFVRQHFPQARERCAWASQDCVTLDGIPYIGSYSPGLPGVYVATGFGLWGMSTSVVAAELLTDQILGRAGRWHAAFDPHRSILRPQLLSNLAAATLDFLTPTTKRCPHLGCALKWDRAEHCWDCPCHGSRFDETGKLLDGPATRDLDRPNR